MKYNHIFRFKSLFFYNTLSLILFQILSFYLRFDFPQPLQFQVVLFSDLAFEQMNRVHRMMSDCMAMKAETVLMLPLENM